MSTSPTTEAKNFQQRMPADLATEADAAAADLGLSRNEFINRAVREAVLRAAKPTPAGRGAPARYELALSFSLAGADADSRAHRLLDQAIGLVDLAGATDATPRLVRLAAMAPHP